MGSTTLKDRIRLWLSDLLFSAYLRLNGWTEEQYRELMYQDVLLEKQESRWGDLCVVCRERPPHPGKSTCDICVDWSKEVE